MGKIELVTGNGKNSQVDESVVEQFGEGLRGELLRPGDPGYDDARQIWNAMIDKRPALIARCTGAADVMQSVRFARDHGALIAIHGAGHNIAGNAVCDGGIMIDLSLMKTVRVDPEERRAHVGPGATFRAPNGLDDVDEGEPVNLGAGWEISITKHRPSVWQHRPVSTRQPASPG